jgi:hypothetical protein
LHDPRRTLVRWLTTLGLIAGLLAALAPATAQPVRLPVATQDLAAIKPELREEIAAVVPDGLPAYDIAVAFPAADSAERTLHGTLSLDYTNTTGTALDALPFRLYANGPDEGHDAITIDEARVGETAVTPEWSVENSVATITLPEPLEPADEVSLSLAFTTHVPEDERAHYGIFNYATEPGTWALAHWYPILAGRDESGWVLDPPSLNGDPVFSNTARYRVAVSAPESLSLITSGVVTDEETSAEGRRVTHYQAAPSRDFVMVADADMRSTTREVAGTTVTSWYEPGDEAAGEAVADWSARSLELFNDLLGDYPYQQLQVAQVEIFGAAGVEFPQLLYIDDGYYNDDLSRPAPTSFEFTVAHEVVHQWFYNLVGNNQYAHAFIDEGLTNYLSSEIYFGRVYDEAIGEQVRQAFLDSPYETAIASGNDQVVDTPTDAFPSSSGYIMAAYSKAPLGFAAIREAIGDEAFFAGLRAYVEAFRFRIATPQDLRAALEAASGQDLTEIWTFWFESKEGD